MIEPQQTPGQMMLIANQRIDKIIAAHVNFKARGMLDGPNVAGNIASLLSLCDDALELNVIQPQVDERDEGRRSLEDQNQDDVGALDEPESQAEVQLAQTSGESFIISPSCQLELTFLS